MTTHFQEMFHRHTRSSIHQCSPQAAAERFYELTVPQEIICWITIAIATAKRVNPERIITALEGNE